MLSFFTGSGSSAKVSAKQKQKLSLAERKVKVQQRKKPLRTTNIFGQPELYDMAWEQFGDHKEEDSNDRPRGFFTTEDLDSIAGRVRAHQNGVKKNKVFGLDQSVLVGFHEQNWMVGGHKDLNSEHYAFSEEHSELCLADTTTGKTKGAPLLGVNDPLLHPLLEDGFDEIFGAGITKKHKVCAALSQDFFTVNHTHITEPFYDHYVATIAQDGQDSTRAAAPPLPPPVDTAHNESDDNSDEESSTPPGMSSKQWKKSLFSKAQKAQKEAEELKKTNADQASAMDKMATAQVKVADASLLSEQNHSRTTTLFERVQDQSETKDATISSQQGTIAKLVDGKSNVPSADKKPSPTHKDVSIDLDEDEDEEDSADDEEVAFVPYAASASSSTRRSASKQSNTPARMTSVNRGKTPKTTASHNKPPRPPGSSAKHSKQAPGSVHRGPKSGSATKQAPGSAQRTPKSSKTRAGDSPTVPVPGSSTRRGKKRSGSPLPPSPFDAKRPATGNKTPRRGALPGIGVKVRTSSGMTGIVHESLNPRAISRVPVLLDGLNGVVEMFNVKDLEWDLDSD